MAHPHSFKFCEKGSSGAHHQINCTSSGTVLQSLQTSRHFTKFVNNQTFVIERQKSSTDGVIAEHFPCHLIREGEVLCIHTFEKNEQEKDVKGESSKLKDGGAEDAEDARDTKSPSAELITFTVASMGGKNTKSKQIVRNKNLKDFKTLGVYAYSGDTIADALKRDGRFADIVFDDRCQLHELNNKTILEISQNVRPLHEHSYEICLPRGKPVKFTEKCSTEQKPKVKVESSTVGDSESESGEQSTMTKSEKAGKQGKKMHKKPSNVPNFGEMYDILRSQFPDLVKQMEARKPSKRKEYLKLRKEEFVQRTRPFSTMRQVEKLVKLGTSVCTVSTETMCGTGFLLFDNFILTNAHVIEESYNSNSKKLIGRATVNFNMGSRKSLDKEFPLSSDVFAFLKGRDEAVRNLDFALLKLQDSEEIVENEDICKLPRLLNEYTSNQHAGGICIIGHPRSDEKRMNVSCIVPHSEDVAPSQDSVLVSFNFLPDYIQSDCKIEGFSVATYDTYFLKGSSGSPVFDEHCKLVAMHTGGFLADETVEYAIGYGIPLHSIIWNIIGQLASRDSLDVMFNFIEKAAQNPQLEEYLKECEEHMKKRAEELARNPSERKPYIQQILQEIDVLNSGHVDEEDEEDEEEAMQCSPVKSRSFNLNF